MLVIALKAVEMNWFPFTYILDILITNSIHAWLTKDYRSSGMSIVDIKESYYDLDSTVHIQCTYLPSHYIIMA